MSEQTLIELQDIRRRLKNWEMYEPHTPHCECYNGSVIALASGSSTLITFDSEADDLDGMHSLTVNPGRVNILMPGIYHMDAGLAIDKAAGGYRRISLRKNATVIARHAHYPSGAED